MARSTMFSLESLKAVRTIFVRDLCEDGVATAMILADAYRMLGMSPQIEFRDRASHDFGLHVFGDELVSGAATAYRHVWLPIWGAPDRKLEATGPSVPTEWMGASHLTVNYFALCVDAYVLRQTGSDRYRLGQWIGQSLMLKPWSAWLDEVRGPLSRDGYPLERLLRRLLDGPPEPPPAAFIEVPPGHSPSLHDHAPVEPRGADSPRLAGAATEHLACPGAACEGRLVPHDDRGHVSWWCPTCAGCYGLDQVARAALLRGRLAEARRDAEATALRIAEIERELRGGSS